MPPLVGWAAVTGSVSGTAVILFFIVFFWTPPHFWALSLLMKDEYGKVGVPMLPVVRGEAETRRQILLYSVLLYAVTQLPFCAGGFGVIYLVASLLLGLGFIAGAVRLYRRADRALGAAPVPVLARLPGAAVLLDGRRRAPLGARRARSRAAAALVARRRRLILRSHDDPTPCTQEHPHRPDRARRSACSCSASPSWSPPSTSHEPLEPEARRPARRSTSPGPRSCRC